MWRPTSQKLRGIKWIKWILLTIGVIFLIAFLFIAQPWVFLPHKHIEISLPFSPEVDAETGLIPMGEKFEHNESNGNPNGHPGIDFGWNKETKVLAIADGRIINIRKNSDNQIIVEQSLGFYYRTIYQELNKLEPDIKVSSNVKKGQVIGQTGTDRSGFSGPPPKGGPSGQLHWDFTSSSMFINRLCPLNYFDEDSKRRIEKIWANVPSTDKFKKEYPDICSGFYKGREK